MAASLLAVERKKLYLEHDCSSPVQYAVRFSSVESHHAYELLRVARALEHLPTLSAAFRDGLLSWSKIREVTRVAGPSDEKEWTAFALTAPYQQIQRRTVVSPRSWKSGQGNKPADAASAESGQGNTPADAASAESGQGNTPADAAPAESEQGNSPAAAVSAESGRGDTPVGAASAESEQGDRPEAESGSAEPRPPRVDPRIGLTMRLTPEQFQLYEQVERSIRSKGGPRMTREEVFEELCRRALGGTPSSGRRSRTRVVVHYDRVSEKGWMETSRGVVAVSESKVKEMLDDSEVLLASKPDGVAEQPSASCEAKANDGASSSTTVAGSDAPGGWLGNGKPARRPRKRPAIPIHVLDVLFIRSGGRCERPGCGRSGYLHVHHKIPWSRGGTHDLANLLLVCTGCHGMQHAGDGFVPRASKQPRSSRVAPLNVVVAEATAAAAALIT